MKKTDALEWHKSSYSGASGGNCVEVAAPDSATTAVRDSKDPNGPRLRFSNSTWASFAAAAAGGAFGEA
ncbi:DUF397 domain-containing protein [Kitasatospora phosalacinea]|uniref:DUF397 domain-containing protein n=1 Tax=Kitasatospora phosalacinea TaxID=2065 RepID=A0A9W6PEN8_9ACTN|nr:DUF397 domain-containing protein [Kitasatospora phosalacinea]GLW53721.1 hypothetical protein Kpho01_17320 [Kitasatospora phosalacinea]